MPPADDSQPHWTRLCAILAGGRGSRIGGNKAVVEVAGRPLIDHAVAIAREAGLEPVIVAKPATELGAPGCGVVVEPEQPSHPLLGIAVALAELGEPIVVCPCDMPLLPAELLHMLAGQVAEIAVISGPRGIEPLLGRYEPAAAPALLRAAESGTSARQALSGLGAITIEAHELAAEAPDAYLLNVNTPADRAGAERLLSRR